MSAQPYDVPLPGMPEPPPPAEPALTPAQRADAEARARLAAGRAPHPFTSDTYWCDTCGYRRSAKRHATQEAP